MKKLLCLLFVVSLCFSLPLSTYAQTIDALAEEPLVPPDSSALIQSSSSDGAVAIARNMSTGSTFYYRVSGAILSSNAPSSLVSHGYFPKSTSLSSNESLSPNQIITPNDNRKIEDADEFPYSAICFLEITFPSGKDPYPATAFLISENVAMTAGHCLYSKSLGEWATEVKLFPGKSGYGFFNNPFGTATATEIVVNVDYYNGSYSDQYDVDWGFIKFESNDIDNDSGYLGFRYMVGSIINKTIMVSGYPNPDPDSTQYYQYADSGTISTVKAHRFYHTASTQSGHSGSPVLYWDDTAQEWLVFGIHVASGLNSTYNEAVGFDDTLFSFAWNYK